MAVDDDIIRKNPAKSSISDYGKPAEEKEALTVSQQEKFMEFVKQSNVYNIYYPMFTIMIGMGLRCGELIGLTWMMDHPDIYEREQGLLPVSVIEKPIDKRMASTVRHNRARGSHDVDLMSNIVKELHEFGRSDAWISKHLGMDRDEILRLKQITGLAALFKDIKFGEAWRPVEEETAKDNKDPLAEK